VQKPPLFTVFTPSYNRAWSLPRVFNCLKTQTIKDFEWIIVDDGSTDNTRELVEQWQQLAEFSIIYHWQPNQGKHIAYNTVASLAKGELFTNIDSDDEIIPEALETMAKRWGVVAEEQRKYVSGIMFVSKDQYGNIIGDKFPEDGEICDLAELLLVRKIKGDKGGFLQTRVFKMYPFPESVKNVLVPEMVFIHQLAHDWKTMCVNDVLRIYWIDEREDHLGGQFADPKSYSGIRLSHLALLNYSTRLFWRIPKTFFANTAYYIKTSLHLKISLYKQCKDIETMMGKMIWMLSLPAGYLLYKWIVSIENKEF